MLVLNIKMMNGDEAIYQGSVEELHDVINAELGAKTDDFIKSVLSVKGAVLWDNVFGVYYNI